MCVTVQSAQVIGCKYAPMENFIRHFIRIGPGIWTCVRPGEYEGPSGRIQVAVGSTFTVGTSFMGIDPASLLEQEYSRRNGYDRLDKPPEFMSLPPGE